MGDSATGRSKSIDPEVASGLSDGVSRPANWLDRLCRVTGSDFSSFESEYRSFIAAAQNDVQNTSFVDDLSDLHLKLKEQFVVGNIRAVDAWADGETAFKIVPKSWESVVDKLYRINLEENADPSAPPAVPTIREQAERSKETSNKLWITPDRAHEFADDLLRTKFVVPFVDGVIDVSSRVVAFADDRNMKYFRRYHAKDSGYHAHHIYVLMPVATKDGGDTEVVLEIKVLTKLQDTLGELTHLLYELKRTGQIKTEKKRKLAWLLESPDFTASYVGHSAHYIEAAMVSLKTQLGDLGKEA